MRVHRFFRRPSLPGGGFSAFMYGFAHVLDLGGSLARHRGRFADGPRGDARALRRDWQRALGWAAERADEQKA